MTAALELGLDLPPPGSRDLRRALHGQLKAAILSGRLRPGLQLPASRALAQDLRLSRNTVLAVYDLLLSEGLIVSRPGAGAFVAAPQRPADDPAAPAPAPPIRHDLRPGLPDTASFPFDIWGRLTGRTLRRFSRASSGYRAPAGHPALRQAIAGHLSFARALAAEPDEIVVTVGAQQAFDLAARTLVPPGRPVVVEDPGYPATRAAFEAAGCDVHAAPVDGEGLIVRALPPRAGPVAVTPAHAFPMGVPLSARRRAELLAFARANDVLILEDDYGGEFRFDGPPVEPLRAMAPDRVAYVGTFSQSLLPALRIGFVIAPPPAVRALVAARELTDWHGPAIEHGALAAFIAEGHLARHVRRMRRVYAERRRALLSALAERTPTLEPLPGRSGLHVTVLARRPLDADEVAARAAAHGLALQPLSAFAATHAAPEGFILGFGLIEAADIPAAIDELARLLPDA